eukprot:c16376_g1_i3.p1 GENE.c16376_g1_i3~~c16376_g1_i3.p1  ORF type:complete len:277 (+),score=71.99 c16376_g1_i3:3-833(+)
MGIYLLCDIMQVLAGFRHPNIVQFIEVVRTPQYFCIVTELMKGGELLDRIIEMQRLSEEVTRDITKQLLEAVGTLHEEHVMHRDLKPENILLVSSNPAAPIQIKVADFGFAVATFTPQTERCGTPQYSAPEVLKGELYNEKADIWSLGVVVYVLLTGCAPFPGDTINECLAEIEAGPLYEGPEWEGVSHDAVAFVRQLLNVDPDTRPCINQVKAHAWVTGKCLNTSTRAGVQARLSSLVASRQAAKERLWKMHGQLTEQYREMREQFERANQRGQL